MRPRLVKDLLPPPRPRDFRAQLDAQFAIMVNLGFLALLAFLAGRALNAIEGTYVALTLTAAVALYAAALALLAATGHLGRLAAARTARDEHALARWRALHYCADCDLAFAPGWQNGIPTRQVRAYIAGRTPIPGHPAPTTPLT